MPSKSCGVCLRSDLLCGPAHIPRRNSEKSLYELRRLSPLMKSFSFARRSPIQSLGCDRLHEPSKKVCDQVVRRPDRWNGPVCQYSRRHYFCHTKRQRTSWRATSDAARTGPTIRSGCRDGNSCVRGGYASWLSSEHSWAWNICCDADNNWGITHCPTASMF